MDSGISGNCIKRFLPISRRISRIGSTILFAGQCPAAVLHPTLFRTVTRYAYRRFLCTRFLTPLHAPSSRAAPPAASLKPPVFWAFAPCYSSTIVRLFATPEIIGATALSRFSLFFSLFLDFDEKTRFAGTIINFRRIVEKVYIPLSCANLYMYIIDKMFYIYFIYIY